MAWWNGTFDKTEKQIEEAFPIKVTQDLRTSKDGSEMVLVNRFPKNDPLYALSDPHLEKASEKPTVFYHAFFGEDKAKAQEAIFRFIATGHGRTESKIHLLREEEGKIFEYSLGEICVAMTGEQKALAELLPKDMKGTPAFVLPLILFKHPCPVCGHKTLTWRGWYEVCTECGWEDDGTDDENAETGPNGAHTIRSYRRVYLRRKNKDPDYNWWTGMK